MPRPTSTVRSIPWLSTALVLALLASTALGQSQRTASYDFSDWRFSNNSGWLALQAGNLDKAESRFRSAIVYAQREGDSRLLARSYHDLAWVLHVRGRSAEAEPLVRWSLAARQDRLGHETEAVAQTRHTLGLIARAQAKFDEAEEHSAGALAIYEKQLGLGHATTSGVAIHLAELYTERRKHDKAESIYRRIVDLPAKSLPILHPTRAQALIGLAEVHAARGEHDRAEPHFGRALGIWSRLLPPESPELARHTARYEAIRREAGLSRLKPPEETGIASSSGAH